MQRPVGRRLLEKDRENILKELRKKPNGERLARNQAKKWEKDREYQRRHREKKKALKEGRKPPSYSKRKGKAQVQEDEQPSRKSSQATDSSSSEREEANVEVEKTSSSEDHQVPAAPTPSGITSDSSDAD